MTTPNTPSSQVPETPAANPVQRSAITGYVSSLARAGVAALALSMPTGKADAQSPVQNTPRQQMSELQGVVESAQQELKEYEEIRSRVEQATTKLESSTEFNADAALELTLLRIELFAQSKKIENAMGTAQEAQDLMKIVEAEIAAVEQKEIAFFANQAKENAGNQTFWMQFINRAKSDFARYEEIKKTKATTPRQQSLRQEMRHALTFYSQPQKNDHKAVGSALLGLSRLEAAMDAYKQTEQAQQSSQVNQNNTVKTLQMQIADGSIIAFETDDGRKSPLMAIDSAESEFYNFGAATLKKNGNAWSFTPDAAFSGTVAISHNNTVREYRFQAGVQR